MKRQKGFTLIELLAVIVILAIIALIATPVILNIIEKTKISAAEDSVYGAMEAIKLSYTESLLEVTPKTLPLEVTCNDGVCGDVKISGTVPEGTIKLLENGRFEETTVTVNGISCTIADNTNKVSCESGSGETEPEEEEKTPTLTLNGASEVKVKQNETYNDLGANAKNAAGETITPNIEIKKDGEVVGSVDTSVVGVTYEIVYSITSDDKTLSVTRTVKIVDGTVPVMTIDPATVTIKVTEASEYNIYTGITVTDNIDGEIEVNGSTVTTSGELKAEIGTYTITYTAKDAAGNSATGTRTIVVTEAEGPILNFSSIDTDNKWVKAQEITVTATDNSTLGSFTYEVFKDDVSQGVQTVSVTGNSATADVSLLLDGTYKIKLEATDEYGNKNELESGIYKIDVTAPTIETSDVEISESEATSYNLLTGVTVTDNSGVTPTVTHNPTSITATVGTYTITYTATDEAGNTTTKTRTVTVLKSYAEGETVTFDPGDGESTTWNVIAQTSNTVTLMLNKNLDGTVVWQSSNVNSDGPVTVLEELNARTTDWRNVPAISSYEYVNNAGGTTYTYGYQKVTITNGTAVVTKKDGSTTTVSGTSRARLITGQEAAQLTGYNTWNQASSYDSTKIGPDWMKANLNTNTAPLGYWTLSARADGSSRVWTVYYAGSLGYDGANYSSSYGVRPVITISKSSL